MSFQSLAFPRLAGLPTKAAILVAISLLFVPTRAFADACGDSCDNDQPPCSVKERCPDSGVECYDEGEGSGFDECVAGAKEKGLELRCVDESEIYCAASEEIYVEDEGCALKSPKRPSGGVGLAGVTFAATAVAIGLRMRRRAKAGGA